MKYSKIRKFSKGLRAGGYRDRAEKGETGRRGENAADIWPMKITQEVIQTLLGTRNLVCHISRVLLTYLILYLRKI